MSPVRFALAAEHLGRRVDLWKLTRYSNRLVTFGCDHPTYHHSWKDGQRPHFTAQDGLDSAPIHPDFRTALQAREPGKKVKRHPAGRPVRWSDVEDYQFTHGLGFIYPDEFSRFGARTRMGKWERLVVPLREGEGVQLMHYLAWPTDVTKQWLLALCSSGDAFAVWVCNRWDPWSVVRISTTRAEASPIASGV